MQIHRMYHLESFHFIWNFIWDFLWDPRGNEMIPNGPKSDEYGKDSKCGCFSSTLVLKKPKYNNR